MAIAVLDKDMKYIAVNENYIEKLQIEGDIIGKSHYEVFDNLPKQWIREHKKIITGIKSK